MSRIMAIDLGTVRTGVAVSDELGMLAQPWKTLPGGVAALEAVVSAVEELKPSHILVGLPRNMNGSYGPAADAARGFADQLRGRVGCAVDLWDERLTTVAAQRALRESGRKARDQRGVVDQVAAQILLQSWLDRSPCA
ncbi:MAG: Holliday junction resolvase RuvX [Chthoniobacterales bacterium]|jgi:putative holliday junction resolvase|nr:Holliday junction resolvase RuvX [Chthoniobacterales bacterium]